MISHCNTLQHTATHLNRLKVRTNLEIQIVIGLSADDLRLVPVRKKGIVEVVLHCNTPQHNATHCNTLQHTATHCNTLQHTATHCNTLQHNATQCNRKKEIIVVTLPCDALQHTGTHCNTLQPYKGNRRGNAPLQRNATICNTLLDSATRCDTPTRTIINTS